MTVHIKRENLVKSIEMAIAFRDRHPKRTVSRVDLANLIPKCPETAKPAVQRLIDNGLYEIYLDLQHNVCRLSPDDNIDPDDLAGKIFDSLAQAGLTGEERTAGFQYIMSLRTKSEELEREQDAQRNNGGKIAYS